MHVLGLVDDEQREAVVHQGNVLQPLEARGHCLHESHESHAVWCG